MARSWIARPASGIVRYGAAFAALAVTFALCLLLRRLPDLPVLLIATVIGVTWFGGRGPGLLTALLATVGADYLLLEPAYSFKIALLGLPRLAVFALTALVMSWASDTRRRAEDSLLRARDELEARVRERTASLTNANAALTQEIAERHRAEEASVKAQAELARVTRVTTMGELAASIAHEINQPLGAVVANASACRRWLGASPPNLGEAVDAVQRIVEDGNRAGEVIARIRRLMAKTAPRMTQVQINDVIRETLDFMRGELQKQHVVVRTALADALPSVPGDPIQLQQVLVNLILNGAEAMASVPEPARRLDVRSDRHEPDGIIVAVRDNGAGLTAEMADRMFEAFFSTKRSGLGMGLSISRSIIEAHGGRLWATPDGGPGATLQFTIPGDPARA